jgi:hypothetical protein
MCGSTTTFMSRMPIKMMAVPNQRIDWLSRHATSESAYILGSPFARGFVLLCDSRPTTCPVDSIFRDEILIGCNNKSTIQPWHQSPRHPINTSSPRHRTSHLFRPSHSDSAINQSCVLKDHKLFTRIHRLSIQHSKHTIYTNLPHHQTTQ